MFVGVFRRTPTDKGSRKSRRIQVSSEYRSNIIVRILSDIFPTTASVGNIFRPITDETLPMKNVVGISVGIVSVSTYRNFVGICDEFPTNFFFPTRYFRRRFLSECRRYMAIPTKFRRRRISRVFL